MFSSWFSEEAPSEVPLPIKGWPFVLRAINSLGSLRYFWNILFLSIVLISSVSLFLHSLKNVPLCGRMWQMCQNKGNRCVYAERWQLLTQTGTESRQGAFAAQVQTKQMANGRFPGKRSSLSSPPKVINCRETRLPGAESMVTQHGFSPYSGSALHCGIHLFGFRPKLTSKQKAGSPADSGN